MDIKEIAIPFAEDTLTLQVGKYAQKSDVSVFARLGDTCVLVTLVAGSQRDDMDYLPLFIEYVEKLYAGGRIKGSRWVKREGKPSDDAVLTRRLIDRGIRPLFPKTVKREVQIIITLLSLDNVHSPEILSSIAASAALHLSHLPWNGPIATSRVGYVVSEEDKKGTFVVNPSEEVQNYSKLDLVVTSNKDKVLMIETESEIISEDIITQAIELALVENRKVIEKIEEFARDAGRQKEEAPKASSLTEVVTLLKKDYARQIEAIMGAKNNEDVDDKILTQDLVNTVYDAFATKYEKNLISQAIFEVVRERIRTDVLSEGKRVDGRKLDEVRPLFIETSILPRTHGSAVFQRGRTQVLSIATLGSPTLEQLIEGPEGKQAKRYMHHYYSPPYSYGEVGRMMFPSAREIGHGALAEKAIEPVLPTEDVFPYVIRIVSEVLSSNGSTSMASTCGSTLALMDAGVPIKAPVAGISIGLIYKSDDEYTLLTDIAGIEDFTGDMDFKVAGTEAGITAVQLDVKNDGLTMKMIKETLVRARTARLFILEKMAKIISAPRGQISQYAPKVVMLTPPEDKIGEIIGPGGKNIKNIIAKTETDINITDDGKVSIAGLDQKSVDMAVEMIKGVYRKIEIGEEFDATVKRIMPFGAFVEMLPGKEGLVHVSQMAKGFVKDPHDIVSVGDTVHVKVLNTDPQGRISLSMLKE